ncbi:MAG: UDP-N-acetylmuramoyl-tripeptide--D-alanyl-D-alanine ligase [Clostridia bacterium]|nr:UDP-N-acetylmuramoyl-tripeptide--D-alanyl-D-alanine ligase [Clostridia bacterium]
MKKLLLSEIASAVGGTANGEAEISGICIDSRLCEEGLLYIAIHGENFDGHNFTASALENGATAAMIHHDVDCEGLFIRVDDTREAFLRLANWFRSTFDIPVVGLTGSVGKTTTKEMTWAVLSEKYNTIKTEGNLNNDIGLPRTLMRFEEDTQAAVIEMGMSNKGEISVLSKTAEPTIAIISNIGVSHMESLGSRENICAAKLEILDGLREGCPILLNGDDPYLASAKIEGHPVIYYGINDKFCDFRATDVRQDDDTTSFVINYGEGETQNVTIPTIGIHNVYNAVAAFAAGLQLGVTPEQAAEGLKKYQPSGMRQRVKIVNSIRFIEDCYNASPDSQQAALRMLSTVQAKRKIAVLGDMLELGAISEEAHKNAGLLAARNRIDVLMTYGELSQATAERALECGVPVVKSFLDKTELADTLVSFLQEGDAVLFKASRGMALEDVINNIYDRIK